MTCLVGTVCMCIWSPLGRVISPHQDVCEVHAQAVFPSLQVVNVCGGGSLGNLSKLNLWKLFSLDSLNEQLLWNPSPAELTSRLPNKHRLSPYKTYILLSIWVKFFITVPDALMLTFLTENWILYIHIINVYVVALSVILVLFFALSALPALLWSSTLVQRRWIRIPQPLFWCCTTRVPSVWNGNYYTSDIKNKRSKMS